MRNSGRLPASATQAWYDPISSGGRFQCSVETCFPSRVLARYELLEDWTSLPPTNHHSWSSVLILDLWFKLPPYSMCLVHGMLDVNQLQTSNPTLVI